MKKVKTERLNVKMGHSTRAAYLMHISLFEYSLKAFFTQLFTAKSKYTRTHTHKKENFQSFYRKPRNAMPPVCCWAWTQKALFTIVFFFLLLLFVVFFRQSCNCNCVKLKYAPCCVVSSFCPNDLICVWKPPPAHPEKGERSVGLSLVRPQCWERMVVFFFPPLCPASPRLKQHV